jgi:DNA-binding response OmpR family regulator
MDKIKILIVDDDPEICELTQRFFLKKNYEVYCAQDPGYALDIVKEQMPQIVLLDVRLEECSGMDLLRNIKEVRHDIKVIMVTALNDEQNVKLALSLGADDYIIKPYTCEKLNEVILKKIAQLKIVK